MRLFYSPGACSLAPHIALREAEIPVTLVKTDLAAKKTEDGADYLTVNPKGYVPALELDNGEVLTEVPVVLQYIADHAPRARLAPPAGSFERYRLQEWLNFVTSELHKGLGSLFNPKLAEVARGPIEERAGLRLAFLDKHLANNDYLMGGDFTVADPYAFTILGWSKPLKIDISRFKNLEGYRSRIHGRPAVQAAMKAEGLLK
jgi:glutathione S-transferase